MLEFLTMLNWEACHQLAGSIFEALEKNKRKDMPQDELEVIASILYSARGQRWSYRLQQWRPIYLKIVFDDLS